MAKPQSEQARDLAAQVMSNLVDQHDWTEVETRTPTLRDLQPTDTNTDTDTQRPILSGLPPRRLYTHPDEQVERLRAEDSSSLEASQEPEYEWVVPVHVTENMTLSKFAVIFDSIDVLPKQIDSQNRRVGHTGKDWRGLDRVKRILVAVVHDDSTVSYYFMHDGIVKPRQN